MGMSLSKLWEMVKDKACPAALNGVTKSWTPPSDWTTQNPFCLSSDSKWPNIIIKTNYNHCSNSEENFLNSLTFIYIHEYTGKCFCPYNMGTHVTFQPEAFCFPLISQGTSWSGPNPLVMHCLSSFNCSIPFHSFLVEAVFQLILKLMLFTLSFFLLITQVSFPLTSFISIFKHIEVSSILKIKISDLSSCYVTSRKILNDLFTVTVSIFSNLFYFLTNCNLN